MPAIYFLFVFFLFFSLLSEPYFTDEQESFIGAYSVLRGKDLYASFHCQHMPFSYYYAVPLAWLGARTVFQFRLGTYVLLSAVWEGIYLRHRRAFHPAALAAMPLLYLTLLKTLPMGSTMLADHWVGLGLILILLEIIRYADSGELPRASAGMAALGISLSLGFSFASAYALFCFFLGAAAIQGKRLRAIGKDPALDAGRKDALKRRILREDLRLVGLSLLPFALLLGGYALTGNLENFYISCFQNVTQVYSKSVGGLGSDPVGIVGTTLAEFARYLAETAGSLGEDPWSGLMYLVCAGSLAELVRRLWRKSRPAAVLAVLAAVYAGLRGYRGFHSMPYQALTAASLALLLDWALGRDWRKPLRWGIRFAAGISALVLLADFVLWAGYNLLYPQILRDRVLRSEERILQLLTEPGEEVCACDLTIGGLDLMDLELTPKDHCFAIIYHFFYSAWGDRLMASVREQPHIVLYDPETDYSGSPYREYAADFDAYVQANYARLPQAEAVWVSREFLPEAQKRLAEAGYGNLVISNAKDITANRPEKYVTGGSVSQRFTAEKSELKAVRFCASTYFRRSDPSLLLQLRDAETGEWVARAEMTGEEIAETFFTRCPMSCSLAEGREYELVLTAERIGGKGDMQFYFTPEGELALAAEYAAE